MPDNNRGNGRRASEKVARIDTALRVVVRLAVVVTLVVAVATLVASMRAADRATDATRTAERTVEEMRGQAVTLERFLRVGGRQVSDLTAKVDQLRAEIEQLSKYVTANRGG